MNAATDRWVILATAAIDSSAVRVGVGRGVRVPLGALDRALDRVALRDSALIDVGQLAGAPLPDRAERALDLVQLAVVTALVGPRLRGDVVAGGHLDPSHSSR